MSTYTQITDPTVVPVQGQSGAAVSALQTKLNAQNAGVAGYTPLVVDGKYGALTAAAAAFKAPTPVVTPPATDPLGGVRRYTGTNSDGTPAAPDPAKVASDTYYNGLSVATPDPAAIQKATLAEMQGKIDTTNNVYAGLISDENVAGVGRVGKTRATDARSGVLGSDFGNADATATDELNKQKVKALVDERDAKIASILADVQTRSDQKTKDAQDLYFKNNEAKLAYNKQNQTDARTSLTNLASTGVSLDSLSQDEYNKLIEQTGYSDNELKAAFTLAKPKADVLDHHIVGSKYFQISKDPITGKVTSSSFDLGFSVPPDYKSQQLDDGTLIFTPNVIDPSKPLKDQVLMYGKEGQFAKPPAPGSNKLSGEELKQELNKYIATPAFQGLSPEDKALYIQSQGGTPYDFGY